MYLIENIDSEQVRVCLDIGHALAYSKLTLKEWIIGLKSHIEYIHLHWNNRQNDSHSIPSDEELALLSQILIENDITPIITLEYRVDDIVKEVNRVRKAFDEIII